MILAYTSDSSVDSLSVDVAAELPPRYRFMHLIGEGAFATVWKAFDCVQLRPVAIKRFHTSIKRRHQEFYKELAALAQLSHPNIVTLYDLFESSSGRPCLVLEYCPRGTLRQKLEEEQRLSFEQVAKVGMEIAAGLEAAHRLGLTHRDLKPENVLLGQTQVKIADFGLARGRFAPVESRLGGLTGSPAYMSPEQFCGKWSSASDTYSLGVLLFEMLHGRLPFFGSPGDLARMHLRETPCIDPGLPKPWPELLRRLLSKNPAERPTATELVIRLQFWRCDV